MVTFKPQTIETIEQSFVQRQKLFSAVFLMEIDDCLRSMGEAEQLCMKFLLAYMPDQDVASFPVAVLGQYVDHALKIQGLTEWGKDISDEFFLNYVLQYRINNENVDFCLEQFAAELLPRIQGLTLEEAVLEVNLWCFEKGTYQSTDIRSVSPKTFVNRAFGRCGEESTFCTAALRSVGIAARQVYTPRWSHCDDNHAWVEVFIRDQWHFLGACEPEAALDQGWFQVPASRAMLVHSRNFSPITSETCTIRTAKAAEVNLLDHYAESREIEVTIVDGRGKPISGLLVAGKVVNFSELYTIIRDQTDERGCVRFKTGIGDLVIYAYKDKKQVLERITVGAETRFVLTLKEPSQPFSSLKVSSAPGKEVWPVAVTEQNKQIFAMKQAAALRAREERVQGFYNPESAAAWAQKLPNFRAEVARFLVEARGNYAEIISFIEETDAQISLEIKIRLLAQLTYKDLADTSAQTLMGYARHALQYENLYEPKIFDDYVLNPRVEFEMITDYREALESFFSAEEVLAFRQNPKEIYDYIQKEIADSEDTGYSIFYGTPLGVMNYKRANPITKRMLFVAICRALGIPAYVDAQDKQLVYYQAGQWKMVHDRSTSDRGFLVCTLPSGQQPLVYKKEFTIGRFDGQDFVTLELADVEWENQRIEYRLEPGLYRIVTTNRSSNGDAYCNLYMVNLAANQSREQQITLAAMAQSSMAVSLSDHAQLMDKAFLAILKQAPKSVLAYLRCGEEPTEHLLNELIEEQRQIQALDLPFIFVVAKEEEKQYKTLKTAIQGMKDLTLDVDQQVGDFLWEALPLKDQRWPILTVIDNNLTVEQAWSGYQVGIGTLLLKQLK